MRREDRRDSYDEKEQKKIIKKCCKQIAKEYNLDLDLSNFDNINRGTGKYGKYFSRYGKLTPVSIKRNHCSDSKAIDGVVYFRNKKTNDLVEVYFFCKFTRERGGEQDCLPFEIEVTRNCIEHNSDERVVVLFMLEGGYWTPSIISECGFDEKKTIYVNRYSIVETFKNILKSHKLI